MKDSAINWPEILNRTLIFNRVKVLEVNRISGGCINNAVRLRLNEGSVFVKWNSNRHMLVSEAQGLEALRARRVLKIPEVFELLDYDGNTFLFIGWIEQGNPRTGFWEDLGTGLAEIHLSGSDYFG